MLNQAEAEYLVEQADYDGDDEWTEGTCDNCYGQTVTVEGGLQVHCACAIGQGAGPGECQCGPPEGCKP